MAHPKILPFSSEQMSNKMAHQKAKQSINILPSANKGSINLIPTPKKKDSENSNNIAFSHAKQPSHLGSRNLNDMGSVKKLLKNSFNISPNLPSSAKK